MSLIKPALFTAITLFLILYGCGASETETISAPAATGEFHFCVLKAGKADAIIMQTESHCVIIDCGEKDDGDEVAAFLSDNGIELVDYLFITHFDADHVGGAPEVIDNVKVGQIITPDYDGSNKEYKKYAEALDANGITPLRLTENMSFILDDVLFEIFPPQRNSYAEEDNDFSLGISISHGDNHFLFAGDAESVRISEILAHFNRTYDFLKFPHHGRCHSNTDEFIKRIKPAYTVITDSDKNPAEDRTVDLLRTAGSEIYFTKNGDVSVSSNGIEITVTQ